MKYRSETRRSYHITRLRFGNRCDQVHVDRGNSSEHKGAATVIGKMRKSLSVSVLIGVCVVTALPNAPGTSFTPRAAHRCFQKIGGLGRTGMRLRGGSEDETTAVEQAEDAAPGLYAALKDNRSLDPNDHPSSFQWALAGDEFLIRILQTVESHFLVSWKYPSCSAEEGWP